MIPMADNMNHNSVDVTLEVINYKKHLEAESDPEYYRINKYLNDYTVLYDKNPPNDEFDELNIKGRFEKKVYK